MKSRAVSKGGVTPPSPKKLSAKVLACHFSPRKFSGGQPFGKICKEKKNKGVLSAN